jgi:histidyl-tRNA synthetase
LYQAPRGTADILPDEQPYWRYVERAVAEVTGLYGYQRIDTPVFEETGLFTRGVGEGTDIVEKEMYTFKDKGGKSLTLRPEGTAPVCRAYVQHGLHNLPQPVKLFYLAPIFRYERPQAGRLREHHQFGVEAIGDAGPALDAEVIDMAWGFYRLLGLTSLSIQLNSIGCRRCRPAYLDALKAYYAARAAGLCADCQARLDRNPLRLLDCKQESCQPVAAAAPASTDHLCPECAAHFSGLKKYLDRLEIPFTVNHRLVRGLDYYTRTVFEVQPEKEKGQSSLGAGGRYDDLIEALGGRPAPAIGFGVGIERVILNLKKQAVAIPAPPSLKVLVVHTGEGAADTAVRIAAELRGAGVSAVAAGGGRSLKAQLRQANSLGVAYAVIIGEDELKAGAATLRHMADARQETIPLQDLPALINSELKKPAP